MGSRCANGNELGEHTLYHVDHLAVAFQDVEQLRCLAIPDEEMARVTARDDVFVLEAEEVYVFDGFEVAMAAVHACVFVDWNLALDALAKTCSL